MNNNIINDLEELRNDTGWLIGSENIANALDVAIKRVKDWGRLKEYISNESYVSKGELLDLMAEMENENDRT